MFSKGTGFNAMMRRVVGEHMRFVSLASVSVMPKVGRPRDGKDSYFGPFRIKPEDRAEIVAKAKAQGLTLTDFVIFSCLQRPRYDPKLVLEDALTRLRDLESRFERLERMAGLGGFE